ncbi:protein FRA10AC1-like [Dysidea avara]|uniref:protein FRA10AC1-like n=1 Tax=Dysidea avara TaxID=196820 RepID=UPI0033270B6E
MAASFEVGDYDSEFDTDPEKRRKTWRDDPLAHSSVTSHHNQQVASKRHLEAERDKEEWRLRRHHLLALDAYSRHKQLINNYLLTHGKGIEQFKRSSESDKNDYDVLKEQHCFLWDHEDEPLGWESKLAKAYYDKLFKEYSISDLSRYKENKIALRWRVEKEVVSGKGQFVCGNKHCDEMSDLQSWEVNFGYMEHGEKKNALVKLRLCPQCSGKLNYHHKRRKWKPKHSDKDGDSSRKRKHKHEHKKAKKRKKEANSNSDEDSEITVPPQAVPGSCTEVASDIWSKPVPVGEVEKSKEHEFDEYFKDMFL